MKLCYMCHKTFTTNNGVYERECFINPYTDKVYCLDTDITHDIDIRIDDFEFGKNGKIRIKKFTVIGE